MRTISLQLDNLIAATKPSIKKEVALEFALSDRIYELMTQRGMTKVDLARALGKRPSEVTKWVSGQHNFTLRTIAMLEAFFGEPLITVAKHPTTH